MAVMVAMEEGERLSGRQPGPAEQQAAWVAASQAGDREAFNRLVLAWQQKIFNLGLRMLGDRDEAAEATQEAFLSAFKGIRRFRVESTFSTWLYRIAVNECRTRLRRRSGRAFSSLDGQEGEGGRDTPLRLISDADQEQDLQRRERSRLVRQALEGLAVDERLAVELKFYQERTFDEISQVMEAPLSTVKSRFYRGLHHLKEQLAAAGD
jgi:RNA polymerase sigma-70 factor (ECF subfamily)